MNEKTVLTSFQEFLNCKTSNSYKAKKKKLVYSSEQYIESYELTGAFKISKFHVHWSDGINCKTVNLIKKKSLKLNTSFSLFNLDNFFFNVSLAFALYCIMYHNHLSLITNNRIMCLRHRPLLC